MRYFKVVYKRGKKRFSTIIEAENKASVLQKFSDLKLGVLIKISETSKPFSFYLKEIQEKLNNPIKNIRADIETLISIIDQISIMIDAGLPLNTALAETVKTQENRMLKAIFTQIMEDIEGGKSFFEAAKRFKKQLGFLTLSMIRLGEETGTLPESLNHLSKILQAILDNRRKFKKATRYPLFVMFAMIISFVIVIVMVIPQFKQFFEETKMELPLPTKFLLWLEHLVVTFGPYILIAAVAIFSTLLIFYTKNEKVRLFLDKWLLKVYIIGEATLYAMISRFIYVFRVLVEAGIPMIDALKIASEIVENSYMKRELEKISLAIEEGRTLYSGFEDSRLFENMVVEMIKAGEIGGGLGKMLGKVSKIYQDRFDYIVDNIATLIEPILIAAIAGFVLTLSLGIFLPMWNLVNIAG
ncbi:type II secretion system F family protein [Nitrosophilus labii]|uniref:type II secretion system F family protein n=1 Tax=Nitrosophilus labii TaxID=2706014 RepID=UPI00165709AC|nr:type II secretion system F family protein [Nitrosophilus labii]